MKLSGKNILYSIPSLLTILLFDQLTKAIVSSSLPLNIPHPLLGNFLQLTYIRNPNAAFGISFGRFVLPFTILAILVLIVIFFTSKQESIHERIAIGLVLGGALGNLTDRIRFGEVVDFIDVGIHIGRIPVFNIADSAVTIGIFLLLLRSLLKREGKEKSAGSPETSC